MGHRARIATIVAGVAGLLAAAPASAASIFINADITTSQTWTANNEYILTDRIYVTNGATLTIEAGVTVRGEPEDTVGSQNPGTLIIARGSKIRALGTRLHPIVFTDLDDDNIGGNHGTPPYDTLQNAQVLTGQWGGLILLSYGYVANNTAAAPDPARENQIEGLTATAEKGFYGGCAEFLVGPYGRNCDDADSGTLNYISIRYGGFNLSPNNEINGLTLGGVGRETEIDYIDVFNNKDDSVEFFGGTANVKHLISANSGDDGFDFDEGYRGRAQFVFTLQGTPAADKSDKGFEQDSGISPDNSQPFAIPTIYNATVVGLGAQKTTYTAHFTNTAMHWRDNGGGRHFNSVFMDFGGAAALIEGGATSCNGAGTSSERSATAYTVDGVYQLGPAGDSQLDIQDDVFYCFGAPTADLIPTGKCSVSLTACCSTADCVGGGGDACVDQAPTYGGDAGKIHKNNGAFTNAALDNTYIACGGTLPIRQLVRTPSGNIATPDPISLIDPIPATGSPLATTNRATPNDGFFENAPYKGAFAPGNNGNWAGSWSTLARLGYFPVRPQVNVSADITASTTWTADKEYVLTDRIYVTGGATLTIEPGTVVRGEPEDTVGAQNPGTLVIARGSKINAAGTKTNPIVFTDLDDDNVRGFPGTSPYDNVLESQTVVGQWGGIILLGYGYVANNTAAGPDPARENQIEGLTATAEKGFYGGCAEFLVGPYGRNCDDGDSGVLSYVTVKHGGFNLSANNEINGITLGGVGRSTTLDYLEVFSTKDDFMENFGGASYVKHLIGVVGGDDGFDFDEGYRGRLQFFLEVQGTPGSDKNDKGFEQDSGISPDNSQPYATPTIYNSTVVGLGNNKSYTAKLTNTAMHFRDNGGGRHFNSAFLDFGGAAAMIEGGATSCNGAGTSSERATTAYALDGVYQVGPAGDNQLDIQDDVFYCFGAPAADLVPTGKCSVSLTACCATADCVGGGGDTCVDQAPIYGGDAGKIHKDNGAFTNVALDNTYVACGSTLPIRTLQRSPNGNPAVPDPVVVIDPRPAAGSLLATTNRKTPSDGFYTAANYKGAFAPGENWAKGWSEIDRLGLLQKCVNGVGAVPDEVPSLSFIDKSNLTWTRFVNDASFYDLVRANTPNGFAAAACSETNGSDGDSFDATVPTPGAGFYYLVRAENACGQGTLGRSASGVERTGVSCP
jgi:hypothetical protein